MKVSSYLAVFGWLSFVFGAVFLLLAPMAIPMYGLPADPTHLVQARYFGAALFGGGLLPWLVRNSQDRGLVSNTLFACAVASALGLVVSLWGLLDKALSPLGWSSVVIYALLLAGALMLRGKNSTG